MKRFSGKDKQIIFGIILAQSAQILGQWETTITLIYTVLLSNDSPLTLCKYRTVLYKDIQKRQKGYFWTHFDLFFPNIGLDENLRQNQTYFN